MTIRLPADSATYAKWMLEQRIEQLKKEEAAARRRAAANIVAKPAEDYLAAALAQAQRVLREAHAGINT